MPRWLTQRCSVATNVCPDLTWSNFWTTPEGQRIMREHMKVGMTAKQALAAMIAAMEKAGYVHTPFENADIQGTGLTPDGKSNRDYVIIQKALANTDKPGFEIDNHAFGSYDTVGPSMTTFRADRHGLTIQENHMFAFEYMMRHPRKLLTRSMISESVWDMNYEPGSNVIDVYVSSLRRKIDRGSRRHIETVIGSGYRFVEPAPTEPDDVAAPKAPVT